VKANVSLTTTGSLDLDVKSVMVNGTVTLNGAAFPSGSNGSIAFAPSGTKTSSGVALDGIGHYALTLVAGTYDVSYGGDPSSCGNGQVPTAPCNGGPIKTNVGLTTNGELDVDVSAVRVTGTVTLNEQPFPSPTGYERVVFASSDQSLSDAVAYLDSDGTYATMILAGKYDVAYGAGSSDCSNAQAPCNGGVLKPNMTFSTTGTLDLDVKAVTVSGTVTLNGQPIPSTGSRGQIELTPTDPSTTPISIELGDGEDATYTAMVLAGTYDVGYDGDDSGCHGTAAPVIPCNGAVVKSGVSLKTSGDLDLDVTTVQVSGAVTLNGAAFPVSETAGSLVWRPLDGTPTTVSLGGDGVATYAVTLVAGRYVTEYAGGASTCTADNTPVCGSELLLGCN